VQSFIVAAFSSYVLAADMPTRGTASPSLARTKPLEVRAISKGIGGEENPNLLAMVRDRPPDQAVSKHSSKEP